MALLAHAVNHCDNPSVPYRYRDREQAEFIGICQRIYLLIERGEIESRAGAIAQDDDAFQRFISIRPANPSCRIEAM